MRHRQRSQCINVSTKVIEKRAPTDDSVKLLREMESAARDSILAAVRVESFPMDCVVHFHETAETPAIEAVARVTINGEKIEAHASVDLWKFRADNTEIGRELLTNLRDALALEIARKLVLENVPDELFPHIARATAIRS